MRNHRNREGERENRQNDGLMEETKLYTERKERKNECIKKERTKGIDREK